MLEHQEAEKISKSICHDSFCKAFEEGNPLLFTTL